MFVIRNNATGHYVAGPGALKSYVRNITDAQRWPTEAEALGQRCGNETVVPLAPTETVKLRRRPESVTVNELVDWLKKNQRTATARSVEAALKDMTK